MNYTQLIGRLRIESKFDDTTTGNEGADAIEALQARVKELASQFETRADYVGQVIAERDAALAKLAALETQEPVAWMRKDGDLIGASEKRPDYAYTHYYDRPLYLAAGAQAQPLTQEAKPVECPNLKYCEGQCFQCEYYNAETGRMEYPVAQPAKPQPDCRTCRSFINDMAGIRCGKYPFKTSLHCTNGDQYQEATKVVLWRTE
jgi:hypothetical protein